MLESLTLNCNTENKLINSQVVGIKSRVNKDDLNPVSALNSKLPQWVLYKKTSSQMD